VRGAVPGSGQGDRLTGLRGPDLTHVAARSALGARTLPYSRENLVRWIGHNQRLKPGNHMPDFSELPEESTRSIAEFLDSLR
jgi:cytochrome c oxidase subunit 2